MNETNQATEREDLESAEFLAPTNKEVKDFISSFRGKQEHWTGDAYQYHPKGVIIGDLLFVDEWHIWGMTSIYQADDISEGWIPAASGRTASIAGSKSNAIPRPKSGKLRYIYYNGKWRKVVESAIRKQVLDVLRGNDYPNPQLEIAT